LLELDQLARNPFSDSFKVEQYGKNTKDKLKLDGDKSVGRKDYLAFVHQSSMARYVAVAIAPCTMNLVHGRRLRLGECPCIELKPELLAR